jgi:hypothetical protein
MVRPYLPASNDGHCVCVDVSVRIRNHPSDEWVYLQGREREAAGAVYVLAVSLFFILIHSIGSLLMDTTRPSQSNLRFSNK